MLLRNLYSPEGVSDIIGDDCTIKRGLEENILNIFQAYSYHEVQPAIFEYYDVFNGKSEVIPQEIMFKFFDHIGRILVLRPDITTPIARVVATKFKDVALPIRLCYVGNSFRNEQAGMGKLKEFTQAGVELIGASTPAADAEVIALTVNILLASGLKDFQIELGHVGFFKELMDQALVGEEDFEKLRVLVNNKNSLAIDEMINALKIENNKEIIKQLPSLFGGVEVLDTLRNDFNYWSSSLNNLKEIYDILMDYEVEKYISIDLGLVHSISYYTGVIFRGVTHGMGFPVCAGGRYDNLISTFGQDLPATGVAVGVNRLLTALVRQNVSFVTYNIDSIITCNKKSRKTALTIADALRNQGLRVEMDLGVTSDLVDYAKKKSVDGIITVTDEQTIELHNIQTNEKTVTSIEALIKTDSEIDCSNV